jgi:predicted phosphate transport protein (TIGR00153 family)
VLFSIEIKVIEIFSRKKDGKSLSELFVECSQLTKEAFETMKNAVLAYVKGDFASAEQEADKTILLEKQQDRVKEKLFERMFTRETMVFSRSDRIQIIENIDKITDKIEIVVRKLLLYQVDIKEPLQKGIKEIAELNYQIGEKVHEMLINVLEDFNKTKPYITQITDLRRKVREKQWELQKMNYLFQEDFMAFRYTETLIKYLMEAADRAEIFADRILVLIYKYAI